MEGPARAARSHLRLFHLGVVAAMAAAMTYQLIYPLTLGLADNGDSPRLFRLYGITYASDSYDDRYFNWFNRFYVIDLASRSSSTYVSSAHLFIAPAFAINRLVHGQSVFDVQVVGIAHLVVFLAACWVIFSALRERSPSFAATLAVVLAVMLVDVHHAVYFNSFYSDAAASIFLLLVVGGSLQVIGGRGGLVALAGFTIAALLLTLSKAPNALLSLPLAALGVQLTRHVFAQRAVHERWTRLAFRAAPAALVAVSLASYAEYQPSIKVLNVYNAVFLGILPRSPDPAADLRWLGLNEDLVRFSGTTAYSPGIPTGREFREMLLTRASATRLAAFFVTHPSRAMPLIQGAIDESLDLRVPYLGHFERARGLPPGAQSAHVAFWSDLKRAVLPPSPWMLVALGLLTVAAAIAAYRRRRSDGVKLFGTLLLALLAMALVQLVVASFGNGLHEVRKQLFLFNLICDLILALDVAWFVGRCRLAPGPTDRDVLAHRPPVVD